MSLLYMNHNHFVKRSHFSIKIPLFTEHFSSLTILMQVWNRKTNAKLFKACEILLGFSAHCENHILPIYFQLFLLIFFNVLTKYNPPFIHKLEWKWTKNSSLFDDVLLDYPKAFREIVPAELLYFQNIYLILIILSQTG